MATFNRIRNKKQSGGALHGVIQYVLRDSKTMHDGHRVASGLDCCPQTAFAEMMTTKQNFRKTDGVFFYHYVQSFHKNERITPEQANQIGLELAAKLFPGHEVLVATHTDTDEIHNHFVVNSVGHKTGKKLHQSPTSLMEQRKVNDEICLAHGLNVLEPYTGQKKKKGMKAGEYRAAMRGESWKFALIRALEDALYYSDTREHFIQNMEYEGYRVSWRDDRKYITFACPNGMKCRDRSLHDDTYLKENLEKLFEYRRVHGFTPQTPEPEAGWLSQIYPQHSVASDAVRLGKDLEEIGSTPPPVQPYIHTDSRQKRRERLKKLAQGHKLQSEEQEETQTWNQKL